MAHPKLVTTSHEKSWPLALKKASEKRLLDENSDKPVLLRMGLPEAAEKFDELVQNNLILRIVDNYDEQLAELFISENAHLYQANLDVQRNSIAAYLKEHYGNTSAWQKGSWVYFPWSGELVHILTEELFYRLRTIRNRDIITKEQQATFSDFKVACLGMSVGSNVSTALVLQGGSKKIKIADGAVISGSNLNRVVTGVASVGLEKALINARKLYEMNPYIEVFRPGDKVSQVNLESFIDKPWPVDAIVDEMDDLEMKIRLRVEARKRGIPVLMATDLDNDVMIDIERYDLNRNTSLFHGLVGEVEVILQKKDISKKEWLKYATAIIGNKNVPLNLQKSLLKIGTILPTHPQLGGTATMAGVVVAYAVRKLALGEALKSGRHIISLEQALIEGHDSFGNRRRHKKHTKILQKALDSL